ncbi:MAG: hypothetical protein GXP49_01480 [Deltaproteobacteria bacterium]|nr:hypothetical protein [Deltaproteobacteria bacterium]
MGENTGRLVIKEHHENLLLSKCRTGACVGFGWIALFLFSIAWLGQLPVINQVYLAFSRQDYVWCPVHHRLEYLENNENDNIAGSISIIPLGSIFAPPQSKDKHNPCPRVFMDQSMAPAMKPMAVRAHVPPGSSVSTGEGSWLCRNILSYSPKLSPPNAA